MATGQKLLTVEQFANLPRPRDGAREELVRGMVTTRPVRRFRHATIRGNVIRPVYAFVRSRRLGRVAITGVITGRNPDSVRGPDLPYWSKERLPFDQEPEIYPEVPPDLCVEVGSPDDPPRLIQEKVQEYLACGVRLVWYVDDDTRTVTVFRPGHEAYVLQESDTLSGEDVLPGFTCPVAELFE